MMLKIVITLQRS